MKAARDGSAGADRRHFAWRGLLDFCDRQGRIGIRAGCVVVVRGAGRRHLRDRGDRERRQASPAVTVAAQTEMN